MPHQFGGRWTDLKLEVIEKYLNFYTKALKNKGFSLLYIDAFAGTGERTSSATQEDDWPFLEEEDFESATQFSEGSAKIALHVRPAFERYMFIEKSKSKFAELNSNLGSLVAKAGFPNARSVDFIRGDCNEELIRAVAKTDWRKWRSVCFLDPFGLQVDWKTLVAIAKSEAIDLWYLFPISGVNRMLTKSGNIEASWQARLDTAFGDASWREAFYAPSAQATFFDQGVGLNKIARFREIQDYFTARLRSIFPYVSPQPLLLENSRKHPLFLLYFACSNRRAINLARRVTTDILRPYLRGY